MATKPPTSHDLCMAGPVSPVSTSAHLVNPGLGLMSRYVSHQPTMGEISSPTDMAGDW